MSDNQAAVAYIRQSYGTYDCLIAAVAHVRQPSGATLRESKHLMPRPRDPCPGFRIHTLPFPSMSI